MSNSDNEFLTLQLEGGRWYDGSEIQDILSAEVTARASKVAENTEEKMM